MALLQLSDNEVLTTDNPLVGAKHQWMINYRDKGLYTFNTDGALIAKDLHPWLTDLRLLGKTLDRNIVRLPHFLFTCDTCDKLRAMRILYEREKETRNV